MISKRPPINKWLYSSILSAHGDLPSCSLHWFEPEKPGGIEDIDDTIIHQYAIVERLGLKSKIRAEEMIDGMGFGGPLYGLAVYEVTRFHDIGAREFVAVWGS